MRSTAAAQAQSLIEIRRYQAAIDVLRPFLATSPDDADALCLLAQALLSLDQRHEARAAAEAALRSSPDSEWALRLLSSAYLRLSRFEEARLAADRAIEQAPFEFRCYVQRVNVDIAANLITATTWEYANTAASMAPNDSTTRLTLGRLALLAGKNRRAEREFREALRIDPHSEAAQNNLGIALLRRQRLGGATSAIRNAARLDPTSPLYIKNLAIAVRLRFAYLAVIGTASAITLIRLGGDPHRTARDAAVTGRPWPLTAVAALNVLLAGYLILQLRRAVGRALPRVIVNGARRDIRVMSPVIFPLVAVVGMVLAAALGYPAANFWLGLAMFLDVVCAGTVLVTVVRASSVVGRTRRLRRSVGDRGRRAAIERTSGTLNNTYGADYRKDLRDDWPT